MRVKKYQPLVPYVSEAVREIEVQREIDSFLRALSSYPDRFAREPHLSFEQHLVSIMAGMQSASNNSDQHRT